MKVGLRLADETRQEAVLPIRWMGTEDIPIVFVNQVLGQVGRQGEVVLSFGQITPPALLGTPEQQREQAKDIDFLPVKPVARLALTRVGLDDLIRVLQQTRDNYQKIEEAMAGETEEGGEE
jgi:hypothetical protein